jgi:energy-coupling factor transport system ATP-binding protein
MNDIAKLADKVLVMDGGKLAMQGTPEEVFAQHVKLAEIGLALPHSAELMRMAAEKGLPFDGNFLTLDDIEEELWDIEDQIEEIHDTGKEEYLDLEQAIKDALVEAQ